jgi:hypothetical protein
LGAGSLTLIPLVDFPMIFLGFIKGGGVVAALCLPARVLEDPAPGLTDESSADSLLGAWAKIGMVGIGISPSNPGIGEMKLSKVCIRRHRE